MTLCGDCLLDIGFCGQRGCRRSYPWSHTPPQKLRTGPRDWLRACPYCGAPVFHLRSQILPQSFWDFDWRPWCIEDEIMPDPPEKSERGAQLGPAQKRAWLRRWAEERPYRLSLVVANLTTGTFTLAVSRLKQKPPISALYRPHTCEEKEKALWSRTVKSATAFSHPQI